MGGAIKPLSYNWCVILWVGRCQKSNYPYIMMYERKPFLDIVNSGVQTGLGYLEVQSWWRKWRLNKLSQRLLWWFFLSHWRHPLRQANRQDISIHFSYSITSKYSKLWFPYICTIWISFVVPDDYHCVGVKWNPFQLLRLDSQMVAKNAGGPKCE